MNNRRRRKAKARREIARLIENLRPEASSLAARQRIMGRLQELHTGTLRTVFHAPYWY